MPEAQTAKRETTSLKVRPDLWKEVKIEAIRHDKQVSELVEEAIQDWMKKYGKEKTTK